MIRAELPDTALVPAIIPRSAEIPVLDIKALGFVSATPKRKSKGKSPTARSLEHLRKFYPLVDIVERRLPHAFITHDRFGIIDLVAVSETEIIAVQTTSAANMASRVAKVAESAALPILLKVGIRVLIHGWRKNAKGRWTLREVEL
jgi:hypothetical protein